MALLRSSIARQLLSHSLRCHYSTSSSGAAVDLASDTFTPKEPRQDDSSPLVVLHGLYGSKQNWRSLARGMSNKLGRIVHTLDLRNHGLSPHAPDASYPALAKDVAHFIESNNLNKVVLMGHSMGGKVAMALALSQHESIEKLIVVDMAPGIGKISPEFRIYLDAMKEINEAKTHSRKEADAMLSKHEPDVGIRQFLLTNLGRESDSTPYKFRLPLDYLSDAIEEIGDFPFTPGQVTYDKPALFLKGAKSKYINRRNIPIIEGFFPKVQLKTLDAGHWVHAERPKEFLDEVSTFLQ